MRGFGLKRLEEASLALPSYFRFKLISIPRKNIEAEKKIFFSSLPDIFLNCRGGISRM